MDETRLSGTAKNPHGQTQQTEESVQDLYGQAKDAAGEAINAVGKMPASLEDTIRHYIQNRPYTTAAIALALGCATAHKLLRSADYCRTDAARKRPIAHRGSYFSAASSGVAQASVSSFGIGGLGASLSPLIARTHRC